jgi:ArsR family transcriptional regulator, arsenate/arsenite/antimonite-responsive transcriptional repressor
MYQPTPEQKRQADIFKALSDPTRLAIFEMLRLCCPVVSLDEETQEMRPVNGPTVGEVCCRLTGAEQITSTFSRHFKELHDAGLVLMERRGKNVICALNPESVTALTGYLNAVPLNAICCEEGNSCGETTTKTTPITLSVRPRKEGVS